MFHLNIRIHRKLQCIDVILTWKTRCSFVDHVRSDIMDFHIRVSRRVVLVIVFDGLYSCNMNMLQLFVWMFLDVLVPKTYILVKGYIQYQLAMMTSSDIPTCFFFPCWADAFC